MVVERNTIAFNKGNGTNVQGTVRENRIAYNGGVGVKTQGAVFVVGNDIQRNDGRGIEIGNGGYLENRVVSNDDTPPGQVSGGTNMGGNLIP